MGVHVKTSSTTENGIDVDALAVYGDGRESTTDTDAVVGETNTVGVPLNVMTFALDVAVIPAAANAAYENFRV